MCEVADLVFVTDADQHLAAADGKGITTRVPSQAQRSKTQPCKHL